MLRSVRLSFGFFVLLRLLKTEGKFGGVLSLLVLILTELTLSRDYPAGIWIFNLFLALPDFLFSARLSLFEIAGEVSKVGLLVCFSFLADSCT